MRSHEAKNGSTKLSTGSSLPAVETTAAILACFAILFAVSVVNLKNEAEPEIGAAEPALMPNSGGSTGATHTTLVSEFASFNTPGVLDGRVEAIAVDGDMVFVGGTFTQIQDPFSDEIIDQPYLFAYSKSSGNIIRDFDPSLNNAVRALETTGDGSGVFAGGIFGNLNGIFSRGRLAKIDNFGDPVSNFAGRPNSGINTLIRFGNTLYVGGSFDAINGTPVENLAAIDATTGQVLPTLSLDFDGTISTTRTTGLQGVQDIDITSDGQLMVVVGNFETIDGLDRKRLAVVELDGQARVSDWNTSIFDVQCPALLFPQYIRGIDIAPDNAYFVVGTTGFRRMGEPACDTISRFDFGDLTGTDVQPTWINYTGGDTTYDVVATDHAIYAGGHFRWLNNDKSIDGRSAGPGAVERLGMAALDPLNGLALLNWRSDRNPRGLGTFALIAEPEGLYIGDDTDFLNGTQHQKLKFLPIGSDVVSRPELPSLPTTALSVNSSDTVTANVFDGVSFGPTMVLSNSEFSQVRGAMYVGGSLFYADANNNMWASRFNGTTFEPRTSVNLYGQTNNEWNLSNVGGMFFDYEWSRVYYTIQGDTRLFWRAFTPASPYFGNDEFVAEEQGDIQWSDVSGMDVIDGNLYFARNDGTLYRAQIDGAAVIAGTTQAISGPDIDARSWDNNFFTFLGDGEPTGPVADAQFEFESSGSQVAGRFRKFEFDVVAGEPVDVLLQWQDPSAMLNLFVRDASGATVGFDNTAAGSPKLVTALADTGGTYVASVLVAEGSTAYTLQVNPTELPEAEPELLADFEFSSNGDQNSGRFQRFNFDVVAGELIEAEVNWAVQTADIAETDVRFFLRDETGAQIANNLNNFVAADGMGSAQLSAVAETSGRWSVAVFVAAGSADYDVLVNTTGDTIDPVTVETSPVVPDITNIALTGTASQSSTAFRGSASRAVDGNTDGSYNRNSVTHTASSNQPWWEVELSEISTIDSINLYNRTNSCCITRLSNFTVSILDENGAIVFSSFFADSPNPSISIDVGGITGKTVRVQLEGTNFLSIAEVQVMGYAQ